MMCLRIFALLMVPIAGAAFGCEPEATHPRPERSQLIAASSASAEPLVRTEQASAAVRRDGELVECLDLSVPTRADGGSALAEHALRLAPQGELDPRSCRARFRQKPLATCSAPASAANDAESPGLTLVRNFYQTGTPSSARAAEQRCRAESGTFWKADPDDPAVAAERLRQNSRALSEALKSLDTR
jgi:hypothetical protein